MKISGFTLARNTSKLYYPIKESILAVLPIVDEFVIALGDCDPDDTTEELLKSIASDKIRMIHTVWDLEKYPRGMENAHQTDIAKNACSGDWLIYLQADEVIHEKYLPLIQEKCLEYLNDKDVDGFLFRYKHFFGDYDHYCDHHGWYPFEIRIVRNDPEIHSYISAQSFRRIPDFDGLNYRQKKDTYKLKVIELDAEIYHYGWVRPPAYMQQKSKSLDSIHKGVVAMEEAYAQRASEFDFGKMSMYRRFTGSHPKVMEEFISKFDWGAALNFDPNYEPQRTPMKHEKTKYRVLTWIEHNLLGGKQLFGYSNWKVIRK